MWATLHADGSVTDIGVMPVDGRNIEVDEAAVIPMPGERLIVDPSNPRRLIVDDLHRATQSRRADADLAIDLEAKRAAAERLGFTADAADLASQIETLRGKAAKIAADVSDTGDKLRGAPDTRAAEATEKP